MSTSTGEVLSPSLEYEPRRATPPRGWRWWLALVAFVCGVALLASSTWAIVSRDKRVVTFTGVRRLAVVAWVAGLLLLGSIPLLRHLILEAVGWLRRVTPRGRRVTTVVVFVLAVGYLLLTPWLQ